MACLDGRRDSADGRLGVWTEHSEAVCQIDPELLKLLHKETRQNECVRGMGVEVCGCGCECVCSLNMHIHMKDYALSSLFSHISVIYTFKTC